MALAVEAQHYQELFELAPDAYLVTDSQDLICKANAAAVTLLNTPVDQLVVPCW